MKKLLLLFCALLCLGGSRAWAETLTYTLTDVNGKKYTGTWEGTTGTAPSFTGCSGYTLTGESWDGTAYSATINFPFPISSNSVDNQTFIGSFHTKGGYYSEDFLWHVNDTKVIVHSGDIPNATSSEQNKYLWVITPSISGLNITFTIKNVSTGTYIFSNADSDGFDNKVNLSETPSSLTYSGPLSLPPSSSSTATSIYAFMVSDTGKYLSANSVNGGANSQLGVFSEYVHDGISVGIHSYDDLISRYWTRNSIATKLTMLGKAGYPAADNTNATALVTIQTSINSGSYTGNATNYGDLYTKYNGLIAADVVTPTAGFYHIYHAVTSDGTKKYLTDTGSKLVATTSVTDAKTSVFYWTGTNLIAYNGGYYINQISRNLTAGTFTFARSNQGTFGQMNVNPSSGSPWYVTDNADDYDLNRWSGGAQIGSNFQVEEVSSLPVTIGSAGFSTFYSPVNLTLDAGLTAYVGTITDRSTLTLTATDVIPANQGVILVGAEGNYTLTVGGTTDKTSAIKGSVAATTETLLDKQVLTLTSDAGSPVFKKFDGTTLKGFRGYILEEDVPAEAGGVKALTVEFLEDAVAALKADKRQGTQSMYDLNGRRVERVQKGIYVVNGRKVVIK